MMSDLFDDDSLTYMTSHQLDNIDSKALEQTIRYCYTGQIHLTANNIEAMIGAADELKINHLKLACGQFLDATLNVDNCLRYALIAEKYELKSSTELAHSFFKNYCAKLSKSNKLLHSTAFQMDEFIEKLMNNQVPAFVELMRDIKLNGQNALLPENFLRNSLPALFRSFVSIDQIFPIQLLVP